MPFDNTYFSTHAYKDVSFARFSQYWWSNRFYGKLVMRYGSKGSRILEIGSGLGHLVAQLEQNFIPYAIDINHWAVIESKKVAEKTRHVVSRAEDLPYKNEAFSVIICKHVVEHLEDPAHAILEMGRIAAMGGLLLLATPNLDSPARVWKKEKWVGYQDPTHISLKSPAEWLGLIKKAGFSIHKIFSDGFWDVPYLPLIPKIIQKYIFGSLGGLQAMLSLPFLPVKLGESIVVIARKTR